MVARYKSQSTKGKPRGKPFEKGKPRPAGAGRRVGSTNRVPTMLKDAILTAATLEGSDTKGYGGLVGFLRQASRTEPAAFLTLMGKVLPLQINAKVQAEMTVTGKYGKTDIKTMTLEQKQQALQEILGLTRPLLSKSKEDVVDGEFTEVTREAAE
jgi:hypothetical protein